MLKKMVFFGLADDAAQSLFSGEHWKSCVSKHQFVPIRSMPKDIGSSISQSEGFGVANIELNSKELVSEGADYILLNACIEDKKVPKKNLQRRIRDLTQELKDKLKLEKLTKEQRQEIKELAYKQELVRTPEVLSEYHILLNKRGRWLAIGATSAKTLDRCIGMLTKAVGIIPMIRLSALDASEAFTEWVQQQGVPEKVYLGDACKLAGVGNESSASYNKQELTSSELQSNISGSKLICEIRLQLVIDTGNAEVLLLFNVDSELAVSGIKWTFDAEELASDDEKGLAEGKLIMINAYLSSIYNFLISSLVERHKGGSNEFLPSSS
jgi:DNA recombination-dependent growth factor C